MYSDSSEFHGISGVCVEDERNHGSASLTREQDIKRMSPIVSHVADANDCPVKVVLLLNLAVRFVDLL
jgi:hypothetical protein